MTQSQEKPVRSTQTNLYKESFGLNGNKDDLREQLKPIKADISNICDSALSGDRFTSFYWRIKVSDPNQPNVGYIHEGSFNRTGDTIIRYQKDQARILDLVFNQVTTYKHNLSLEVELVGITNNRQHPLPP